MEATPKGASSRQFRNFAGIVTGNDKFAALEAAADVSFVYRRFLHGDKCFNASGAPDA